MLNSSGHLFSLEGQLLLPLASFLIQFFQSSSNKLGSVVSSHSIHFYEVMRQGCISLPKPVNVGHSPEKIKHWTFSVLFKIHPQLVGEALYCLRPNVHSLCPDLYFN